MSKCVLTEDLLVRYMAEIINHEGMAFADTMLWAEKFTQEEREMLEACQRRAHVKHREWMAEEDTL